MQKLHLVGFTTDQKGLILSARRGARSGSFCLAVDQELARSVAESRRRNRPTERLRRGMMGAAEQLSESAQHAWAAMPSLPVEVRLGTRDANEATYATAGDMDAQMFGSSPVGGSESMHLMILLALTAAQKSIDIENAYFVPDKLTAGALAAAARRGVRVRIVVPGKHNDARVGRWAAHALYGDLLNAGVEIYEYRPTMIHCKVLVVDGMWTSVGSANFDDRRSG